MPHIPYHKDGMKNTLFELFPAGFHSGTFAIAGQIRPAI
jgi:hypothetical protein